MKKRLLFILYIIFAFSFFSFAPPSAKARVLINEICWMGNSVSYSDEWIELHNNGENPVVLDGWRIFSSDGSPDIKLKGAIAANEYFLLERTDDKTVPIVPADLIFKGGLDNAGEYLKLADEKGNIIDEANFSSGWIFGDNQTKQTMERTGDSPRTVLGLSPETGWQTSENPGGTPREKNSLGALLELPKPKSSNEPFSQKEKTPVLPEVKLEENIAPLLQAEINQSAAESPKTLIVFLIAIIIALLSVIIFLFIKNRIQKAD